MLEGKDLGKVLEGRMSMQGLKNASKRYEIALIK